MSRRALDDVFFNLADISAMLAAIHIVSAHCHLLLFSSKGFTRYHSNLGKNVKSTLRLMLSFCSTCQY